MTAQLPLNNDLQKKWDEATPDAAGDDLQAKWDDAAPQQPDLQAKWDEATPEPKPTYYQNPTDQAIAEIPGVRQVYRGLANTLQDAKALGYRAKALFHSATDSPAYADEANAAADAIQAEQARSEAEFNKASGLGGNTVAGITHSLGQALATRGMGAGAPAMIAGASAVQGNQALYEGQQAGLTGTDLAAHVLSQAGIEAIPATMSQAAGVGGLEKRIASMGEPVLRGVKAALERFGKTSLEELPEELVTTLGQQVEDSVSGVNPANWQDLANGAFQTTLQTLGQSGLVEVPSAMGRTASPKAPGATQTTDTNQVPITPSNASTDPTGDNTPINDLTDLRALFAEEMAKTTSAPEAPAPQPVSPISAQIMARQQQAYHNPAQRAQPESEVMSSEKEGQKAEVLGKAAGGESVTQVSPPAPEAIPEPTLPVEAPLRGVMPQESIPEQVYHGTPAEFEGIKPSNGVISFAPDEQSARDYAEGGGGNRKTDTYPLLRDQDGNIYDYDPKSDRYVMDGDPNESMSLEKAKTMASTREMSTVNRTNRILSADVRGKNILDATTPDGLAVLASLDPQGNKFAKRLVDEAGNSEHPRLDFFHTKHKLGHMESVIVPQLKALGYDGIHHFDDGHKTFAMFDAPKTTEISKQSRSAPNAAPLPVEPVAPAAEPAAPARQAPAAAEAGVPAVKPVKWKTVRAGLHRATIGDSTYEVVKADDGSWNVLRDERVVADGFKNASEAKKDIALSVEQDARDAANEAEVGKQPETVQQKPDEIAGVGPSEGAQVRFERADGNQQTTTFKDVSADEVPQATRDYIRSNIDRGGYSQEQVARYSKFLMGKEKIPARISDLGDGSEVSYHLYENKTDMNEEFYRLADPDSTRFYNRSLSPKAEKMAAKMKTEKDVEAGKAKVKQAEDDAERKRMSDAAVDYRNRTDAYPIGKGKKSRVQIAMDGDTPIVADMTVYKDVVGVRKQEGKYILTHTPTGLAFGKPVESLSTAMRIAKGLLDSGVDLRKKEFAPEEARAMGAVVKFLTNATDKPPNYVSRGPAPADTGIFRDITAAAREGKRFVEDLHTRIAPVLARIHAAAKSPVEFIRQAVENLGAHIRPYAKRFLADVRRVNAEFAANPTRGSGPVWFSKLSNAVEDKMGGAMDAGELRKMLEGAGVKKDEMQWARLGDLQGKVSKKEVREHIAANAIKVEEVQKGALDNAPADRAMAWFKENASVGENRAIQDIGALATSDLRRAGAPDDIVEDYAAWSNKSRTSGPKFGDYQTPGGTNYGELLLTLPPKVADTASWDEMTPGYLATQKAQAASEFKSSHFSEPNILVHVRHNDRVDADGKRVLFLEEVQSDWHQKGRKSGYKDPSLTQENYESYGMRNGMSKEEIKSTWRTEDPRYKDWEARQIAFARQAGSVPDAPFKSTDDWTALAMRRMVRYAAEHGYDKIAWTTGDMQAERYDLSKQVDSIHWMATSFGKRVTINHSDGSGRTQFDMDDNGKIMHGGEVPSEWVGKAIDDVVGKDVGEKILSAKDSGSLKGEGLRVGGGGMRKHYDEVMRNVANKIGKKWGARAGTTQIPFEKWRKASGSHEQATMTVHSLDIPPTMRDEVNVKGMPLFADTGIFDDIAKAAKEGKKWVAELHERAAPELAKLYAKAKNGIDFVKQAVAKIGEHVRPYAKRFLQDVRKVNAEFAANPTRGSTPTGKGFWGSERKRDQPKQQQAENKIYSEGVKRGAHTGGMRTRQEIRGFLDKARAVLPADQYAARVKIANKLLAGDVQNDEKRQARFNRFIEATRTQVLKATAIKGIDKQAKKLRKNFRVMDENLKAIVKEVLDSFSVSKPTDATINKAEALIQAVADGKEIAHPKTLAAAEKAIDTFLNDKALASMPLERLRNLKSVLENMNALHEGNLEQVKAMRKQQKQEYAQAAKDVVDNTEEPFTNGDESVRKGLLQFLFKDKGMNVLNKILSLAPEGSKLHEIAIKLTNEGENRESAHRIEARDYIMEGLPKLKGSDGKPLAVRNPSDDSYTLHPEFEKMSFMLSDYANKTAAGKAVARKRDKAPPLIRTQLSDGRNVYLSSAERIRLYQLGLDPNARYQMTREGGEGLYVSRKASDKIQKLSAEDLAEVEASLTDNERAIAQLMFDFDNGRVKEVVNEMSRREFGRDIFNEDDKTSYRRYQHDKDVGKMTEHVGKTFIENQGMLKDITGGTSPIVLGDAFSEYFSHQSKVAAIVGRMAPSMRLREMIGTEAFREAVRKTSKRGENTLRDLERVFDQYGQLSGEQDTAMWAVNGILSRLASAWLGLNPKTIITTPMSIWSAQSRIPFRYLAKNMSLRTRDAATLAEMRKYAPKMYEMTTSSGFNVVSPETTGESAQKFFGKGARGHEKAQFFLHESNNIPALMTWKAAKDWGEAQGLKGEELMQFTAEHAQDAYSVAQPDNRWIYTSGAKADARTSAFWRVATFLQGQTSKQYNQAVEALIRYSYTKKTAADKARMLKDIAVPTLGQALLYTAVGYALKYGYDEWDEARGKKATRLKGKTPGDFIFDLGRNTAGNIPIAGDVVGDFGEVLRRAMKGESPSRAVNGSESVLMRPATLIYKATDASVRAFNKPTDANLTKARKALVEATAVSGFNTDIINEALDAVGSQ